MQDKLEAALRQPEIVAMLRTYGFQDLSLSNIDGKASTYKFSEYNKKLLDKMFETPAITSNGKVAVYKIPSTGRIGVSPSASMVRFIDETLSTGREVDKSHLAKDLEVPLAYEKAYYQAQAKESLRVQFCEKLFAYFNKEKFGGKLDTPTLLVSNKAPGKQSKTVRGVYYGGLNFTAGSLWMASFMFNARPPFFYEILLHEMCHLAVWNISKDADQSEAGHGPTWKSWMVKVGLDPRRFDPTDDTEMQVGPEKHAKEAELNKKYGPAATPQQLSKLQKLPKYAGAGENLYLYTQGRLCHGRANKNKFEGVTPNGKLLTWTYKTAKALGEHLYMEK
jgi:hypothetical protein